MVIETKYNGYKFRSRLEARWAVVLDAMDIQYEYEKEGYHFENGMNYLPDFYLPKYDCFLEIKPEYPDPVEIEKMEALFAETGKPVICVFDGFVYSYIPCWVVCNDTTDSGGGKFDDGGVLTFDSNGLLVVLPWCGRDRTFYSGDFEKELTFFTTKYPSVVDSRTMEAIKKGRSARFEFNNK